MKAIICAIEGSLHITSFGEDWTTCQCGNTAARWDDPHRGTMIAASTNAAYVRGLGLVNSILLNSLHNRGQMWEVFRGWHDEVTEQATGYVFHKDRASCWAVPFLIGSTNDTRWATDREFVETFGAEEYASSPLGLKAALLVARLESQEEQAQQGGQAPGESGDGPAMAGGQQP